MRLRCISWICNNWTAGMSLVRTLNINKFIHGILIATIKDVLKELKQRNLRRNFSCEFLIHSYSYNNNQNNYKIHAVLYQSWILILKPNYKHMQSLPIFKINLIMIYWGVRIHLLLCKHTIIKLSIVESKVLRALPPSALFHTHPGFCKTLIDHLGCDHQHWSLVVCCQVTLHITFCR